MYYGEIKNGKWQSEAAAKALKRGSKLRAHTTLMTVIPAGGSLKLYALAGEDKLAGISKGASGYATTKLNPYKRFSVKVSDVASHPSTKNTFLTTLEPALPSGIAVVPGMKASVKILSHIMDDALKVPVEYLSEANDGSHTVQVKLADGKTATRTVSIGASNDKWAVITEGLDDKPGHRQMIRWLTRLVLRSAFHAYPAVNIFSIACLLTSSLRAAEKAPELSALDINRSIEQGADFLVSHQNKNGSWGNATRTKGLNIYAPVPDAHQAFRTASSALALHGLLECRDQRPATLKAIERGEAWLLETLPNVRNIDPRATYSIWAHAYSLRALASLYRYHDDPAPRERNTAGKPPFRSSA